MKTKIKKHALSILMLFTAAVLFIGSATVQPHRGHLRYENKKDELIASERIKSFMKQHPNPSIVLRVPQAAGGATQSDQNGYVYSAIEKELVLGGFQLKDRGLFNQVVNSQAALDYTKIKDITGTDLILELVKVDTKTPFNTNRAYRDDGKEVVTNINYTRYGASIEFKIIIVTNNEYGGSFSFYYAPCSDNDSKTNCYCQVPYTGGSNFIGEEGILNGKSAKNYWCNEPTNTVVQKGKTPPPVAYEEIPQDAFEIFVRNGVKKVIESIKP